MVSYASSGICRPSEQQRPLTPRGWPPFLLYVLPMNVRTRAEIIRLIPLLDGIAAATVGSVLNYLLLGLAPQLDRFYLHSFEILLACTVVFPGVGNVGYTLLEYRLGQRNFFGAMFENLRWIPFLYVDCHFWGCGPEMLMTDGLDFSLYFPIRFVFIACSSLVA